MKYDELISGKLVKRYKRFLTDVELEDGTIALAHCPNSGSMKSCLEEGAEVRISPVKDPKRKTRFTWEMIKIGEGWIGINTGIPNQLAFEWITSGTLPGFDHYTDVRREVKWDDSRFDVEAKNEQERCFVEVKNVTLKEGEMARFPDAVTSRGKKHLETLIKAKQQGIRAVMLYIVQRSDVDRFAPASDIDPEYSEALKRAVNQGVEVIVAQARVSPEGVSFDRLLEAEI